MATAVSGCVFGTDLEECVVGSVKRAEDETGVVMVAVVVVEVFEFGSDAESGVACRPDSE